MARYKLKTDSGLYVKTDGMLIEEYVISGGTVFEDEASALVVVGIVEKRYDLLEVPLDKRIAFELVGEFE